MRRLCHYCKQPMKRGGTTEPRSATWDHKIPKSRGGKGGENKVRCCRQCNQTKGDMTEAEFSGWLAGGRPNKREYLKAICLL